MRLCAGRSLFFLLCAVFGAVHPSAHAAPSEYIRSFRSHIEVRADGTLAVTETISAVSAGSQIRHGIYRDFPTRYRDPYGRSATVSFSVRAVLRDGNPESYHTEALSNGIRVYFGSSNTLLQPGEYTYTFRYETGRQLGFFADFDELYWNVTGTGWAFPIAEASCSVTLPGTAAVRLREADAYTGPAGARGKDFRLEKDGRGAIRFMTTRRLDPGEGLTIVVNWPKGYVREPSVQEKLLAALFANAGIAIGILGLLLALGYYASAWASVGRDPQKGVIVPLFAAPDNLSPAAMRYLTRMGYDDRAFAALLVSMAVKRCIKIEEKDGSFTLVQTAGEESSLAPEERVAADNLFPGKTGGVLTLGQLQHACISKTIGAVKKSLKVSQEKKYFVLNRAFFLKGLGISAVTLAASVFFSARERLPAALFITVWLTFWSLGVFALLSVVANAWRSAFSGAGLTAAFGRSLFALPFLAGELMGIAFLAWATTPLFMVLFVAHIVLAAVFYHLLKAPTLLGRKILDRIEGFRMYLSVAEKDELRYAGAPGKTKELFERYLPFALALGVEQQWAERFSAVLAEAAARGEVEPVWYASSLGRPFHYHSFASSLGNELSASVTSSSYAPGTHSGGGGGGSSGGGGGGGGGGGW